MKTEIQNGMIEQTPTRFPLSQIPTELRARVAWLTKTHRGTSAPYTDGRPSPDTRSAARWRRYWRRISQPERSLMVRLSKSESWPADVSAARGWRYTPPTPEEEAAIWRLTVEITKHFVHPSEVVTLLQLLQVNHPELPALPAEFLDRIDEVVACGAFWVHVERMLVAWPDVAKEWPGIVQSLLQAVLDCRMQAAAKGWTLIWPPAEIRRCDPRLPETRGNSIYYKQISLGRESYLPAFLETHSELMSCAYWQAAEESAMAGKGLGEIGTVGLIPGLTCMWFANDLLRHCRDPQLRAAAAAAVIAIVKHHAVDCADHIRAQLQNDWTGIMQVRELQSFPDFWCALRDPSCN